MINLKGIEVIIKEKSIKLQINKANNFTRHKPNSGNKRNLKPELRTYLKFGSLDSMSDSDFFLASNCVPIFIKLNK